MTLREQIHQSIDALDNRALAAVYEQIQSLLADDSAKCSPDKIPTLQEVRELTSTIKGDWSDEVIAERADRL